jgi:hypothetical protein
MSTIARQITRRNEGGRYSAHSTWYDAIAEERIAAMDAQAATAKLAQIIGDAVEAMPEAAPRIANAARLVERQDVWPLTDGAFLVGSQSDTEKAYLVRRGPWGCECASHTKGGTQLCKHILSVMLVIKLGSAYRPEYN